MIQPTLELVRQRYPNTQVYPWGVARLGHVSEKSRIVGRYMNRKDADDSVRLLNKLMRRKQVQFVVVFLLEDEEP